MENILEFCKGFNIQMLLSVGAIMLYFSRHFDDKIDKLELRMDAKFEKMDIEMKLINQTQSARSDQLYHEFIEINKAQNARTDQLYKEFTNAISVQTARSDQLYQMFIDLLKSKK